MASQGNAVGQRNAVGQSEITEAMANLSIRREKLEFRLRWLSKLSDESQNREIHLMFSMQPIAKATIRKTILFRRGTDEQRSELKTLLDNDPLLPVIFKTSEANKVISETDYQFEVLRTDSPEWALVEAEEGESKEKTASRRRVPRMLFFTDLSLRDIYSWQCIYLTETEYRENFPKIGIHFVPLVVKLCFGHDSQIDDRDKVKFTKNLIAPALKLIICQPFDVQEFQPAIIGYVEIDLRCKDENFIREFVEHIKKLYGSGRILAYCGHDTNGTVEKVIPEELSAEKTRCTDYFRDAYEIGMKNIREALAELAEIKKSLSIQVTQDEIPTKKLKPMS